MLISIIILSVTLSIDALFAGFSYGLSKTRIPIGSKLVICAFSVIYSAMAILIGSSLANVLSPLVGKITGAVILFGLGIFTIFKKDSNKRETNLHSEEQSEPKTIFKVFFKSLGITVEVLKNNVNVADVDCSGTIDKKEALLLGFALSVDSLGAGIGFALSGITSFYLPLCVGVFQMLFLSAGLLFGLRFCEKLSQKKGFGAKCAKLLPGILLLALAVIRLF